MFLEIYQDEHQIKPQFNQPIKQIFEKRGKEAKADHNNMQILYGLLLRHHSKVWLNQTRTDNRASLAMAHIIAKSMASTHFRHNLISITIIHPCFSPAAVARLEGGG